MSFEDYAQYIVQKYRLAIALAVINTKPHDITLERYMDNIRNTIRHNDMDSIVDVSICEDDFNISGDIANDDRQNDQSNDSVTILIDFDIGNLENDGSRKNDANSLLDVMTELSNIEHNSVDEALINTQSNCTQSTFFDESQKPQNTASNTRTCSPDNIITIVRGDCKVLNSTADVNNTGHIDGTTFFESDTAAETNRRNDNDKDLYTEINFSNNNDLDSQQTELYTLYGFTNNTHVSQSQERLVISDKYILSKSKVGVASDNIYIQNHTDNAECNKVESAVYQYINQDIDNFGINDIETFEGNARKHNNEESCCGNDCKRLKIDLSEKQLAQNYCVDTEHVTFSQISDYHYNNDHDPVDVHFERYSETFSQNQATNINSCETFKQTDNTTQIDTDNVTFNDIQSAQIANTNIDCHDTNKMGCFKSLENERFLEESQSMVVSNEVPLKGDEINRRAEYADGIEFKSDEYTVKFNTKTNKQHFNSNPGVANDNLSQGTRNVTDRCKTKENVRDNKRKEPISKGINTEIGSVKDLDDETKEFITKGNRIMKASISRENNQVNELTQDDFSDDANDARVETVSFKTLEELNRIKCYLDRRERGISEGNTSSDSGFRCSQPRSSYKSASQCSEMRINASAHCLMSFITSHPLSDKTTHIAEEISKVLGKLVDKLHEEEIYPNFLEELLETMTGLLNDVYESDNEKYNTLLKKEDSVIRILMLNRSTHIIKYTIDKIVIILEKTLSELSGEVFELENVDKAENICFVFHILETILKRGKTHSSSQISARTSQDDDSRALRKSSLTEIWRRKWNFAKSDTCEGSSKKTSSLTKCSEVLNKIIVQAMNGYSLISFAALQCFNLLQN